MLIRRFILRATTLLPGRSLDPVIKKMDRFGFSCGGVGQGLLPVCAQEYGKHQCAQQSGVDVSWHVSRFLMC